MSDTLEQYLYESNPPISRGDLLVLDSILDKLFAEIGIDVVLTKKHFLDRVNDLRNNPPIRLQEIGLIFRKAFFKFNKRIAQMGPDVHAVLRDLQTDLNIPFALQWNPDTKQLEMVAKTVMRTKLFRVGPEQPVLMVEAYGGAGRDTPTPDDIKMWAQYTRQRRFASEQEAREWIFYKKEVWDRQFHNGDNTEANRSFAAKMPIYQSGKSFKIGKRLRNPTVPLRWSDFEIRPMSRDELTTGGWVNPFDLADLIGPVEINLSEIGKTENHSETDRGQAHVLEIATQMKRDRERFFRPIILDANYNIIDGHHRFEAAKLLGFKTIPAQIVYYHDDIENET